MSEEIPPPAQAAARAQMQRYLSGMLRDLPPSVALSRTHPRYPRSVLSGGHTLACDGGENPSSPVTFGVSYWFTGISEAEVMQYFSRIADTWDRWGWPVTRYDVGPARFARTRSPDGYALEIQDNSRGSLSVSADSPCFPADGMDRLPMPHFIAVQR